MLTSHERFRLFCNIMKNIVILLFFVLLKNSALASSDKLNALMLHDKQGDGIVFLFDSQPVLSFLKDEILVTTDENTFAYSFYQIDKITYLHVGSSGVGNVIKSKPLFRFYSNDLMVDNLTPYMRVLIYSIDGTLISSDKADEYGKLTIALPQKSSSIYILKTKNLTLKIHKQ